MTTRLQHIINQMLDQAEANPGQKVSRILPNRLQIDLKQADSTIYFQIHRSDVYPSTDEWRTVMRALPYPIAVKSFQQFHHRERYYLRASWPVQLRMNLEGVATNDQL